MNIKSKIQKTSFFVCAKCFRETQIIGEQAPEKCDVCGCEEMKRILPADMTSANREELYNKHMEYLKEEIIDKLSHSPHRLTIHKFMEALDKNRKKTIYQLLRSLLEVLSCE